IIDHVYGIWQSSNHQVPSSILASRWRTTSPSNCLQLRLRAPLRPICKTAQQSTNLCGGDGSAASDTTKCERCGTTNSPEWRRGPSGPRTYVSGLLLLLQALCGAHC